MALPAIIYDDEAFESWLSNLEIMTQGWVVRVELTDGRTFDAVIDATDSDPKDGIVGAWVKPWRDRQPETSDAERFFLRCDEFTSITVY